MWNTGYEVLRNSSETYLKYWKAKLKKKWVIDHRSKQICSSHKYYCNTECLELLHKFLCQEHLDKKKWRKYLETLDPNICIYEDVKDIPKQMNDCDCGVFMLKYAEYISGGAKSTFNQNLRKYFRQRMMYELFTSKLL